MADRPPPTLEEIWALFREIGEKIKEVTAQQLENSRKFEDTDAKFKDTDAKIDKLAENIGGLSNKWGNLGEAMTVGESVELFNAIEGINVHSLHPNVRPHYDGKVWEIDGIVVGKEVTIVIEAKATMNSGHVESFINDKLNIFTKLEPTYEGTKIYGAMGFLSASTEAQELAQRHGLLLIRPTKTSKELVPCPPDFKLRDFHP